MKSLTIGGLLLDSGKITLAGAERILRLQKEKGMLFGEAAKALGLITEKDIQQVLAQQFDFPFLVNSKGGLSFELIAAYKPFSTQVETLRAIRSQLMLRWFTDNRKALAIVSPINNEGRSFFAANLAIVFSQLGERTLLIDADLRQPRQHTLFNIDGKLGLSNFLAERVDNSVITQIPGFRDLSVLAAGTIPPNPLELIGRRLAPCLEQLATEYDVILLDTPAGSQGSDAQLLAAKAGGAVLLARQHKTRLLKLEAMKNLLENSGTILVGSIINDF
ncbi:chain length determinant protein tyrosine kinase EpsG [Crenothrix polyspora]|uniref:Chain length determinant protein tyrosine kinase EpsG n=1 Tax=Crenothrix polyspora TaxID=360316 RepID=A0A1R4HEB6_9GAMM|nr:chain length determinant protein tyrosine kinase EpsG [Crenothrix polyspora]SJM94563.1 Chain length determinant protein tyrosine kinase EpsG [Crenothrix polyspora]